jgi:uncharacterized membrane protein
MMATCQTERIEWLHVPTAFAAAATESSHHFDGNFSLPVAILQPIVACVAIGCSERFWNMFRNGSRTQLFRSFISRKQTTTISRLPLLL